MAPDGEVIVEGGACLVCGMVISARSTHHALEHFKAHVVALHPDRLGDAEFQLAQKTVWHEPVVPH